MVMSDGTDDLVAITRARFMAEQGKLRSIVERENALRADAQAIDDQHKAAQSHFESGPSAQTVYGGDVLWQAWVGRSRRQLQMELAQVLVQKGQMMSALQRAHGRKLASESLQSQAHADRQKHHDQRQIEVEQSLLMMDLAANPARQKKP